MKRKYKKKNIIMIDLSDRKNIKIIESDKIIITDDEIEAFRKQVTDKTKEIENFNNYIIEREIANRKKISDEEFNNTMKELFKQHKILKCMLKEQAN